MGVIAVPIDEITKIAKDLKIWGAGFLEEMSYFQRIQLDSQQSENSKIESAVKILSTNSHAVNLMRLSEFLVTTYGKSSNFSILATKDGKKLLQLLLNYLITMRSSVVSGSYAMRCLDRSIHIEPNDVDVYVEESEKNHDLLKTLLGTLKHLDYTIVERNGYGKSLSPYLRKPWTCENISSEKKIQFVMIAEGTKIMKAIQMFDLTICQVGVNGEICLFNHLKHLLKREIHISSKYRKAMWKNKDIVTYNKTWTKNQIIVHSNEIAELARLNKASYEIQQNIIWHTKEVQFHAQYRTIRGSWVQSNTNTDPGFRHGFVPFREQLLNRIVKVIKFSVYVALYMFIICFGQAIFNTYIRYGFMHVVPGARI